jgi:hypothetical protein
MRGRFCFRGAMRAAGGTSQADARSQAGKRVHSTRPHSTNVLAVGTLKRGFPLHHGLAGARFVGEYRSVERFPMLVAGPWYAPMIFDEPGLAYQLLGELYEIDEGTPRPPRQDGVCRPAAQFSRCHRGRADSRRCVLPRVRLHEVALARRSRPHRLSRHVSRSTLHSSSETRLALTLAAVSLPVRPSPARTPCPKLPSKRCSMCSTSNSSR